MSNINFLPMCWCYPRLSMQCCHLMTFTYSCFFPRTIFRAHVIWLKPGNLFLGFHYQWKTKWLFLQILHYYANIRPLISVGHTQTETHLFSLVFHICFVHWSLKEMVRSTGTISLGQMWNCTELMCKKHSSTLLWSSGLIDLFQATFLLLLLDNPTWMDDWHCSCSTNRRHYYYYYYHFYFGATLLSFVHLHSVTVKPSSRKLCSQYINWDSFTKH